MKVTCGTGVVSEGFLVGMARGRRMSALGIEEGGIWVVESLFLRFVSSFALVLRNFSKSRRRRASLA
jgi:hypothetical protein